MENCWISVDRAAVNYKQCVNNDERRNRVLSEIVAAKIYKISDIDEVANIILFCVVKDDCKKMKTFLDYYRRIGIDFFVILDNSSTDGTFEYLKEQPDVALHCISDEYTSERRVAWLNILLSKYGVNKWCLVVDSDEFVSYIGMETFSLTDVVNKAIEIGVNKIEGFLLDMYSDRCLFNVSQENVVNEMRYFDYRGYTMSKWRHGLAIKGGPRERVLGCDAYLSKFPLFYYDENQVYANSHYLYPDCSAEKCHVWFAIRHYKFVDDSDYKKIITAISKENYFNSSIEYRKYFDAIKEIGEVNFYEGNFSVKYEDSGSLSVISFLTNIFI